VEKGAATDRSRFRIHLGPFLVSFHRSVDACSSGHIDVTRRHCISYVYSPFFPSLIGRFDLTLNTTRRSVIARTLHLYPTRIRLPRSPPLTKDTPLVVVSLEHAGDKDSSAVGDKSIGLGKHRKLPSGDGHEDKLTWSILENDSRNPTNRNRTEKQTIEDSLLLSSSSLASIHGHFSTTTSPSVSILPSRTPSVPGSPKSPFSTSSLVPLRDEGDVKGGVEGFADGDEGDEGEEEEDEISDDEDSDIEECGKTNGVEDEEDDDDELANVSIVVPITANTTTTTTTATTTTTNDGRVGGDSDEDTTIRFNSTSTSILRKRIGKGKVDWEGMTNGFTTNGSGTESEKQSIAAPPTKTTTTTATATATRKTVRRGIKKLMMTSSVINTGIPIVVEPKSGSSSGGEGEEGGDDGDGNEDTDAMDPNSSPARAKKYTASQQRYRASSVGVDGPLGLSETGSESGEELGGLGLDDGDDENENEDEDEDEDEHGEEEEGDQIGLHKLPPSSLINLGEPIL
jgi:hypothetical protein